MNLVLVRHGQTEENAKNIVQGHRYGTLSAIGKKQVAEVAKKLANDHFDVIYTSDLQRCVDTAKAIHAYHQRTPLILRTELREFSFGVFEGRRAPKVRWGVKFGLRLPTRFLGVESLKDVQERVIPFINHIYQRHNNQSVLVVTHGGPIRIIKAALENSPEGVNFKQDIPNGSVWRFSLNKHL